MENCPINAIELEQGYMFMFDNKEHIEINEGDDLRQATVYFEMYPQNFGIIGFKILLNGVLIHSSWDFNKIKRKLDKLVKVWNLEYIYKV